MSTLVKARRRWVEPRRLDRINRSAGKDFDACGDRPALEEALDLSHARVHQIAHGDPTGAPQRIAQTVVSLAAHPGCSPYPIIRGLEELVESLYAEAMPTVTLARHLSDVHSQETTEQAAEDVSQHRLMRALGALQVACWDVRKLGAAERMELVAACLQFIDAASREIDHQLACVGATRVMLARVKS